MCDLENNWKVYVHKTPSGKQYFGITKSNNLNQRWANGLGYRTQTVFFRAIIKYGWDNIEHNVLYENLTLEEAKEKEIYLIEKYHTDVNKYGHEAMGYNMTKGGDNIPFYDLLYDDDHRKMMNENVYSKLRIPVNAYTLDGEFVKKFNSMKEAAKELGVDYGGIGKCCKGKANRVGKYRFSYAEKELPPKLKKEFTRQVNMFDFNGNYIKSFDSCNEAARFVNFGANKDSSVIAKCAKGERASYKGYLWSYSMTPFLFTNRKPTRNTPVEMYDLDGKFIKRFNSLKEALAEVHPSTTSTSSIASCCLGKLKTAYGYIWKYAKDDKGGDVETIKSDGKNTWEK